MKTFKHKGAALAGLTCAVLGASLVGCNNGNNGGGGAALGGAAVGNSSDTLATVGGTKVTRADLGAFLEAQGGAEALPQLIDTQLIFENLKTKGLEVSDAEVDADIARLQAANPTLAPIVAAGGVRLAVFRNQIRRRLAEQKLLSHGITATDAQIQSFFEKNRRYYDQAAKSKIGMLFSSTKARADLMAKQLKAKTKTLSQLVAEQKNANDPVASNSAEDASQLPIWPQLAPSITPITDKLPKGGISPVRQVAPQAFAVLVVTDRTAPVKADFAKIRSQVERDYKAAEVAKKTVAQNPQNPPFDETLRRTYEALSAQSPALTLGDVLGYINQTATNNLLASLRTAGNVQIDDASYATVAQQYQAAGAPSGTPGANTAPDADAAPDANAAPATNAAPAANTAPATNAAPAAQ